MTESKTITCNNCNHRFSVEEGTQERPVEGKVSITELGLCCPNCEQWTHAYYDTPKLRNARALVHKRRDEVHARKPGAWERYQKARRKFQRQFDHTQKLLRKELGTQSPSELAAKEG